jgi:TonB family protein
MMGRAFLASLFTFAGSGLALGADMSGIWVLTGQVSPTCSVTQNGESLRGACKGPASQGQLAGAISGKAVKWTYSWLTPAGGSGAFVFDGMLDGDSISGNAHINGTVRPFTAKRQSGAPDPQLAAQLAALAAMPTDDAAAPVAAIDRAPARNSTRTTQTVLNKAEPLVRLSYGAVCDRYPVMEMNKAGGERVALDYVVDADGSVASVQLAIPVGTALNEYVTRCVRSWKFQPLSKTGATAPFTAHAMLGLSIMFSRRGKTAETRWTLPGTQEASDIAMNAMADAALICLRGKDGVAAAIAHDSRLMTGLQLQLRHGDVSDVMLRAPSGNAVLDKAAADCYRNQPHDDERAAMMDKLTDANVDMRWSVLFADVQAH